MQFVLQSFLATLALNEFFQNLEFFYATRLDSTRIVKDVTRMIGEHKFIVDGVLASLRSRLGANEKEYSITHIHWRVKFDLVGSEIRFVYKVGATYLLSLPVNLGALRCITDPLKNRCLSCVCPSYNKHSKPDVRSSTSSFLGLFGAPLCDGLWERTRFWLIWAHPATGIDVTVEWTVE